MEHQQARELFSEYLDGELDAATREALEGHLEECESCQKDLESLQSTLSVLSALKPVDVSPDFLDRVRHKIRKRSSSIFDLSFGLERKIPFEAVSMVLLGILLALYLILVMIPKDEVKTDPPPEQPRLLLRDGGVPDGAPPSRKKR